MNDTLAFHVLSTLSLIGDPVTQLFASRAIGDPNIRGIGDPNIRTSIGAFNAFFLPRTARGIGDPNIRALRMMGAVGAQVPVAITRTTWTPQVAPPHVSPPPPARYHLQLVKTFKKVPPAWASNPNATYSRVELCNLLYQTDLQTLVRISWTNDGVHWSAAQDALVKTLLNQLNCTRPQGVAKPLPWNSVFGS